MINKSRGRPSNRGYGSTLKSQVIKIYRENYRDFGPTLFSEKLEEYYQIKIDHETLRRWIRSSGHVGWHRLTMIGLKAEEISAVYCWG